MLYSLIHYFMKHEYLIELNAARLKAGYLQSDVAHLMGCSTSTLSHLETGKRLPSIKEFCMLTVIFGRTFEALFAGLLEEARADIAAALTQMPEHPDQRCANFNRNASLNQLEEELNPDCEV